MVFVMLMMVMMLHWLMLGFLLFLIAIIVFITIIVLVRHIVIQVFLSLTVSFLALLHFVFFISSGSIVAVAQIVTQFLPVMMNLFMTLFDRILVVLRILP